MCLGGCKCDVNFEILGDYFVHPNPPEKRKVQSYASIDCIHYIIIEQDIATGN